MRTPHFWSKPSSWLGALLSPLSSIYEALSAAHNERIDPVTVEIPVICIGNLVAGGSGKTPLAIDLAKRLQARGLVVHFLIRGYGGHLMGPVLVNPHVHDAVETGDEALLLAEIAPCWVARDRVAGAHAAILGGAKIIIMDDGFQNLSLDKTLSLLVIDGGFGFGNGRLLPAGPLREPIRSGLARAHGIVLMGKDETNALAKIPSSLPLFRGQILLQTNPIKGKRIVGFCGIGRPEKFRKTLLSTGADLQAWFAFGDHYVYTANDLNRMLKAARQKHAQLVTTEKDFVRLPESFRPHVMTLPVGIHWEDLQSIENLVDRIAHAQATASG